MIRVVIAEDDRSVAATVSRVMRDMGYHPVVCSDGRRAFQVIEDNPDTRLLISDVAMPHMDGRELILRLHDNGKFGKLPIIVISDLVSVSEVSDLVNTGMTRFLAKPLNLEDLREYARLSISDGYKPAEEG